MHWGRNGPKSIRATPFGQSCTCSLTTHMVRVPWLEMPERLCVYSLMDVFRVSCAEHAAEVITGARHAMTRFLAALLCCDQPVQLQEDSQGRIPGSLFMVLQCPSEYCYRGRKAGGISGGDSEASIPHPSLDLAPIPVSHTLTAALINQVCNRTIPCVCVCVCAIPI